MTLKDCKTCGTLCITEHHKCPPVWQCSVPDVDETPFNELDDSDYWHDIYAYDPELAVEDFVARWDEDCTVFNNASVTVHIRRKGETAVERYEVYGEPTITYSAVKLEKAETMGGE